MLEEKEVYHIAKLARLELNREELEAMRSDLSQILNYVDKLKEVDIAGVLPTTHVLEVKNVWREDEVKKREKRENLLREFPERKDDFLRVPRVLD